MVTTKILLSDSLFQNFQPMVTGSPDLASSLQLQVKSVDSTVEAGAQFQQMVNLECVMDFSTQPDLVRMMAPKT